MTIIGRDDPCMRMSKYEENLWLIGPIDWSVIDYNGVEPVPNDGGQTLLSMYVYIYMCITK